MKGIVKKLKADMSLLKKAYHNNSRSEWLTDNFYIIEKHYTSAVKDAKSLEFRTQNCEQLCSAVCKDGILPSDDEIIKILLNETLSTVETENISTVLKAELIDIAAKSLHTDETVFKNAIKSLIRIDETDFGKILYETCITEKLLCQDPAGIYRNMSENTKEMYRHAVYKKALKSDRKEEEIAVEALDNATKENRHIGFFLDFKEKNHTSGRILLIAETLIPFVAGIILSITFRAFYLLPLLYLPLWETLKFITDFILSKISKPQLLPSMNHTDMIMAKNKTVIAVSTLLPRAEKANDMTEHLRKLCLSNCKENVYICILADLHEAKEPKTPADDADINAAKRIIADLNNRYGDKFTLAIRSRRFSVTESAYSAHERKRGAITSLVKLIKGDTHEFEIIHGNAKNLYDAKYIMALDSDTLMPAGSLNALVAIASHPFNKPIISPSKQRVTQGYGIISPRMETGVNSAVKTHFSFIFSYSNGLPSYSHTVCERYQDLFGKSIFSGKGLIDVDSYYRLLPDRFPDEQILSHDILEGIVLRNAFAGNIALVDSFPSNENSYFKRLHRWIRGDMQNILLLFDAGCKSVFDTLGKWWLADNIRRAVTPIISVITIILSFFMPDNTATVTVISALLSVSAVHIWGFLQSLVNGGFSMIARLYFSDTIPNSIQCIFRAVTADITLIHNALTSADALIRSLYRMFISRKHLLQWTTAADSENSQHKYYQSVISLITGAALLIFGNTAAKIAGILFIADLPFAILSANEKKIKKQKLNESEKKKLTEYTASMWKFYEEFCNEEHNFLIPDNVQYSPVFAVADRTSPTNIGLMLCAFLGARDFNFIDSYTLYCMLSDSLATVEKLPKYKGNLYNWYNTRTLEILNPHFISTVDSGNFLCCLTALRKGLEIYTNECHELDDIIKRINIIINSTELDFLYNNSRNLFHIGYDVNEQTLTSSHFDLLMSEARMTSYFAVASGKVPIKHWQALGRTLSKKGRYTGPVSWSGTMFEYFMPALFLPSYRNTIGSEALKFCIHCQKSRVSKMNIPYGISESCYYAFDSNLNYSYKAHGVNALSLKNDKSAETVISPYSTFLTLSEDPHSAMQNLEKQEKNGALGRFGFVEAIDFTPERCNNSNFQIVNSFMSHHIGMSFIASANCIFNNIFNKRFITDDMMFGCQELLYEQIPCDVKIHKNMNEQYRHTAHERFRNTKTEIAAVSATNPRSVVFSNGKLSLFACDTGCNVSAFGNISLFKCRKDSLCYPDGVFSAVKYNNTTLPFSDAPYYNGNKNISVQFTNRSITYKNNDDVFDCSQTITLHPTDDCQYHTFRIKNKTKEKKNGTLMIYAEPALQRTAEQDTHPAYSNMFIKSEYIESEKVLVFTRMTNSKENKLYLSIGFRSKTAFEFSTDRESILSGNNGIFSVFDSDFNNDSVSVDKCVALQIKFNLSSYGIYSDSLIIAVAHDKEESLGLIIRSRSVSVPSASKCAPVLFANSSIEGIYANKICERFLFSGTPPYNAKKAAAINNGTRNDLWSTGISGDFPVILVRCEKTDITPVLAFVSIHGKLSRASIPTELVFLTDCADGYTNDIKEAVISVCADNSIINKRAGIFILNINELSKNSLSALTAAATVIYPEIENENTDKKFIFSPISPSGHSSDKNMFTNGGYLTGRQTYLPYSHIISNRNFGTLISNYSLGFTWALNSRENKITPWYNDTRRAINGEMLILKTDNGRFDLIKGSCSFFKKDMGEYYAIADGLNFRTTVRVYGENMCKTIEILIINDSEKDKDFAISYYLDTVLADIGQKQLFIKKECSANRILFKNIYNDTFKGYAALTSDNECEFHFNKCDFLSDSDSGNDTSDCIIAVRKIRLKSKSDIIIKFNLSYGNSIFSAIKFPYIKPKKINENRILINTPDKNLNCLFNNFLPSQIINGRIFARTGFYQCSGAFGFRDQLQDAMAVALTHPEILRIQILRCCSAQFTQGDVLHWFHQLYSGGRRVLRGVRTLYSDDLLWLPLAVSEYCKVSGDLSVLDMIIPYIQAPVLEKGETERFGEFVKSDKTESVYKHCIKAITHACQFGEHSIPLIKGGDWNDSFNAAGIGGKGESIWLGMFLSYVLKNFASICDIKRDSKTADTMRYLSKKMLETIDMHAWDKDRYLRCFYDDGTPMGKNGNSECAIDLLPQAWSVISGMPDKDRCKKAVDTAYNNLVDKKHGLIRLFTPPFNEKSKLTGYVNKYPEGVRENGGQYTHGVLWLAQAYFLLNEPTTGYELLNIINPANKNTDIYKTEPYYLAGDVYSAKGMEGRGGWSLYTGSAGWFYRIVSEYMLGITKRKYDIKINPRLPENLRGSRLRIELNGSSKEFVL